jgi:hypothetical protein
MEGRTIDKTTLDPEVVAEKKRLIKKEIARLGGIYKDMDPKKKKIVQKLIKSAAFMSVTLRELENKINNSGCVDVYQNGASQWGIKKSPEVEIYNTMSKNHAAVIAQLTALLDKAPAAPKDDGFNKFLELRKSDN